MPLARKLLAALALVTLACSPAVPNATVKTGNTLEAVQDAATIVVVQPRTKYKSVSFVDGQGRLLGQLDRRSHTLLRVPPGAVRLYAFWENKAASGDRIEGTVLAGKIYFATIGYRGTVGGIALLALNPRSPDRRWEEKDRYLSSTPRVQLDPARAAEVMQRLGAAPEIFRWADEHTKDLTGRARDERVILPGDGI
jgi:hypothetical protein